MSWDATAVQPRMSEHMSGWSEAQGAPRILQMAGVSVFAIRIPKNIFMIGILSNLFLLGTKQIL